MVYRGRVFDVVKDRIRDGEVTYDREVVVHNGSAVIVPLFEDGTLGLVRQYRHAAGDYLLEVPAGTLSPGEDPAKGAARELEEEIGVTADSVEKLCEFYVSPGFLTEKMNLYLATGLTHVGQKLEDDEILTVERHGIEELQKMFAAGEIRDAKTIIAIQLVSDRLHRDGD